MSRMTWEVVSTRDQETVTAQFRLPAAAQDYARFRNEQAGWRAWKAREINPRGG